MTPSLSQETLRTVHLLFAADHHAPMLLYSDDRMLASVRCRACSAVIRWRLHTNTWVPETDGYQAGLRCAAATREGNRASRG